MNPWEMTYTVPPKEPMPWEMGYDAPQQPQTGKLKAFGRGFEESTSFGLTDELRGFGRAVGTKIRGDERSFPELVSRGIDEVRNEYKQAKQDRPGYTLTGEIAGAVAPALTPGGQAIAARMGAGGLGARMLKGGASGALSLGAYGFGTGEGSPVDRLPRAAKYAAGGAALGGAAPAVVAGLGKANQALGKSVIPTSEQIREQGGKFFQLAEQKGGVLKSEIADDFLNKVLQIRPQTEAGRVFKGKTPVSSILDDIPSLQGKPMTLQAAKEVDEALGDLAYGTMDKFGKLTSDGKKFLDMQTSLRRTIENADENMIAGGKEGFEALKQARKYWATSLRLRDIEKIIDNAQYMEQPATALRTGFRTLLRNPDRLKGYTPAEVKAIEKAAKTGIVTDFFRLAGSGLVPIGSGIGGTAAAGPAAGALAGAAGFAVQQGAKSVAVARQMSRANKAAEIIAQRSGMVTQKPLISTGPLAKALAGSKAIKK